MEKGSHFGGESKVRLLDYQFYEQQAFLENNQVIIYLLVNPRSGSQEGKAFTDLEKNQFNYELESGQN